MIDFDLVVSISVKQNITQLDKGAKNDQLNASIIKMHIAGMFDDCG